MALVASKRLTDGAEFAGTTDGEDRVAPGAMKPQQRYVLESFHFHTASAVTTVKLLLWDAANNEQAGELYSGTTAVDQKLIGPIVLPVDSAGNSYEVRCVTTGHTAGLMKCAIQGRKAMPGDR